MFVLYWGWADIAQDSKKLGGMCSHRECGFTGREGKKAYFENTSFMPDEISIILETFYSVGGCLVDLPEQGYIGTIRRTKVNLSFAGPVKSSVKRMAA